MLIGLWRPTRLCVRTWRILKPKNRESTALHLCEDARLQRDPEMLVKRMRMGLQDRSVGLPDEDERHEIRILIEFCCTWVVRLNLTAYQRSRIGTSPARYAIWLSKWYEQSARRNSIRIRDKAVYVIILCCTVSIITRRAYRRKGAATTRFLPQSYPNYLRGIARLVLRFQCCFLMRLKLSQACSRHLIIQVSGRMRWPIALHYFLVSRTTYSNSTCLDIYALKLVAVGLAHN